MGLRRVSSSLTCEQITDTVWAVNFKVWHVLNTVCSHVLCLVAAVPLRVMPNTEQLTGYHWPVSPSHSVVSHSSFQQMMYSSLANSS